MELTFLIFFREVLEISLIIGIIMAATKNVAGRNRWILLGMAGGLMGSAAVAYFADSIADAMEGMGQEVFNASILIAAAFMIGWTVVWMKTHARQIMSRAKQVGASIADGSTPLYTVALVVCLAMWREGSEVVLFMYGALSISEASALAMLLGGLAGTLVAASMGMAIYYGLLRLPIGKVFQVSSWILLLLACGMAAQAAGLLSQAGMIPELANPLWDTSHILAEDDLIGRILHGTIGYMDSPSGMQVVWYMAALVLIASWMQLANMKYATPSARYPSSSVKNISTSA